jgi:hypothetical protein
MSCPAIVIDNGLRRADHSAFSDTSLAIIRRKKAYARINHQLRRRHRLDSSGGRQADDGG